jgi:hypothetical protein
VPARRCSALLLNQAGALASASSFWLCRTPPAPAPPATTKPVDSMGTGEGSGIDSVLFAWSSHGLRYGFAMVCGVSAASPPPRSHGACRRLRTTALHIIETLPRPERLQRFGGADSPFGLPRVCQAIRFPPRDQPPE